MAQPTLVPPRDWLDSPFEEQEGPGAVFLLAMTLLAAGLRFYHLAGASLWVDEILTWQMIDPARGLSLPTQFFDAIQGPLYLLVIWPLTRLQENEWLLRAPAAVAGVLTVPAFGLLLGQILDRRSARLGTLLLAISPFHLWYSQEARGYSFLLLFVVLLAWFYVQMIERRPAPGRALLVALMGAAAVLSNMSALFLLVAMGLAVLLLHRPTRPRGWIWWAVALGGAVLLSSPWILKASGIWAVDRILPGADMGHALRGQTTFSPLALPYSVYTFFIGHSFGPSLRELHAPDRMAVLRANAPYLGLVMLPVGLGLLSALRHLGGRRLFLLVLIVVPVGILVILALRNIKPWNPRYVAVAYPFLLALLALGLTRLPGRWAPLMAVAMVVLSLWSVGNHFWNGRYAKADIRGAVAWAQAGDKGGLPVLAPAVEGVWSFYAPETTEMIPTYHYPALADRAAALDFFRAELADRAEFLFVVSREWYFDPHGVLPKVLARRGHLELEHQGSGVRVYHWRQKELIGGNHGQG
ncbi:hypothetical protein CSA17_01035 [bacterium DOLJORAL78_65_58]|nr:MAG: hypothetical protein CSB20_00025 [bacterium DOLZORAL124_64_63]PIE76662.1 MAG: hypothetical protein CSA17_01035 [bacterium DOLJORAL78_65_58]